MKRKFMALALAAAMTVSMTSAVFAADEIKSADDLEGKKIGVQLGTTGDTLATDIKDATVERYNKGNDAVLALKQGKVDCVVIDSEPAKKFVEKNDDLQIIENVFDKEEYAICLSPLGQGKVNYPAFIAKLKEIGYQGDITIEREISGEEQKKDIRMAKDLLDKLIAE